MNIQDLNTKIDNDIDKLKEVRRQFDLKTKGIIEEVEKDHKSVDALISVHEEDKEIKAELSDLDEQLNNALLKFATKK